MICIKKKPFDSYFYEALTFLVSVSQSEVADSHEFSKTVFISYHHDLLSKTLSHINHFCIIYYVKIMKSILGVESFIYV